MAKHSEVALGNPRI